MDFNQFIKSPTFEVWLWPGIVLAIGITFLLIAWRTAGKANQKRAKVESDLQSMTQSNQTSLNEIRTRLIESLNIQARLLMLYPVIPGNTIEDTTLESRNRAKCLSLITEDFPRDLKSQGIRMAEFTQNLCDNLFQTYSKESNNSNITIDTQPIILDAECAAHVGLILNELISNSLQYAPVPGEKTKITVILKERNNKLHISVGDNGIGMKQPYQPKFSFGLQLVSSLVKKYQGEMTISSRPGTRIEIYLSEYKKAIREVFVTPTQRIH